ncbi:MAG: DegT/DnrJ/EryC1/StrS family aminotransferase [Nitrososphaerota archaeon]|nr:DegT/DnrJ/EryC1/StrS family aminotransferase [Nitrososphaerota archaeon]MDG7041628.1 DegT/DnrJ/EryC1/StrS family aminotransferase [Nitrososphaerota archaeon]MDG7048450.1 DegT/DnrJ/EryC1/StrS family aminotransferase [Nitrososphaerota archaeon]
MIPINAPIFGEEELKMVKEVIQQSAMTDASYNGGNYVREFESGIRSFVGARDAIAVNSGTAALHVALMAIGVGPGDEVLLPSMTFIASANAVKATGARPVFVDVDEYYTIDSKKIEEKVTSRSKAIMPVHLYGHTADMSAIMKIANERSLYVIEDAAQSLGSVYGTRMTGTIGHIGCYSFYPGKVMTTGEGGALVTDDYVLADRARMLRNHGYDAHNSLSGFGLNYRLNQLSASIGISQLKKLPGFLQMRASNAYVLNMLLDEQIRPKVRDGSRYNWYLYTIMSERRNQISAALRAKGIDSRVYYDPPVHLTKAYLGQKGLSRTEEYSTSVLSLPVNPLVKSADLETMASTVNSII